MGSVDMDSNEAFKTARQLLPTCPIYRTIVVGHFCSSIDSAHALPVRLA